MKKLRKQRDEDEKRRKSSTGGMSTLLGNILSKDEDKKRSQARYVQLRSKNSSVLLVLNAVTVIHHNHTKTEGSMVNILCGEIFTDSVFSKFRKCNSRRG